MKGSSDTRRFKSFQIRWAEKLGYEHCPYLVRWTFIFFGYSMRIHHWIKSDDKRFYHDHSADLLSIVLKGKYKNVVPQDEDKNPDEVIGKSRLMVKEGFYITYTEENKKEIAVEGIFNSWHNFFHMKKSIWYSKAEQKHYLDIPNGGAWTLMFEGRPRHKWGFYVNGHKWRPLRYFHKYGILQDKYYQ